MTLRSYGMCRAPLVFSQFVGRGVYVACVRTNRRFIFASDSEVFRRLFERGGDYLSTYFACRAYNNSVLVLPEFVHQCVCISL